MLSNCRMSWRDEEIILNNTNYNLEGRCFSTKMQIYGDFLKNTPKHDECIVWVKYYMYTYI